MSFKIVNLSGADPFGALYTDGQRYLRGINCDGVESINLLFQNGLIQELSQKGLIPKTIVIDKKHIPHSLSDFAIVLEHEAIAPLSYPREWSFEMVKQVALTSIELTKVLSSRGFTCKDSHLFNWTFRENSPVWLDITSFVPSNQTSSRRPWKKQFWLGVVVPLLMWKKGMPYLASKAISSPVQTLSVDEALTLLNLNYGCKIPVVGKYFKKAWEVYLTWKIEAHRRIEKINYSSRSLWGDYHDEYFDNKGYPILNNRFERILELLKDYKATSVLELAGNAGALSQIIAKKFQDVPVLCTDYDPNAIDCLFQRCYKKEIKNLSMAILDFMVTEYSCAEIAPNCRFQSDCVLALAVTHHLLLTQGYSYEQIFETITLYSKRLVFIEFMPLGLHNGVSAPPIPHWYTEEKFKIAFKKYFKLHHVEQLDENRILYIGEMNKTKK